jgi:hypothetical protein
MRITCPTHLILLDLIIVAHLEHWQLQLCTTVYEAVHVVV